MLLQEIKEIKSEDKDLRNFGFVIAVFLVLIGVYTLYRDSSKWLIYISCGVSISIIGLVIPRVLLPFQKIWMGIAVLIGWVMTRVLLFAVFFIMVTPISLIAKISGKKFLDLRFNKTSKSYWVPRDDASEKINYEHQF